MNVTAKIKHALSVMCAMFTVIMSVMYVAGWLMSDKSSLLVPTPIKALSVLLFCAVIGFLSLVLSKEKMTVARYVIHMIACLAGFILLFLVGSGFPLTGGASILATAGYLVIYGLCMLVRAFFNRKKAEKSDEEKPYTAVFK